MGPDETILEDDGSLYELAATVVGSAADAGLTVGCAESCTGGLVCGCLTAVPGSSSAVRGSVVSYAIPVKHEVLGVSNEDVLEVEGLGAVSAECAAQMAEGGPPGARLRRRRVRAGHSRAARGGAGQARRDRLVRPRGPERDPFTIGAVPRGPRGGSPRGVREGALPLV